MCLVCLGAMWEKTAFEFAFVGLGFQRSFLSEAEIKKGDGKIFGIDEDIVGFNIFMDDFSFVDLGKDLQQGARQASKSVVSEGFSLSTN